MTTDAKKFHGLYKGVVVSNIDPLNQGRLLVQVDDVVGPMPCIWAEPATPLAGVSSGQYIVPLMHSGVWIQFINGDPDRAVWTGFWRGGTIDVPTPAKTAAPGVPQIVLGTPLQNYIVISDVPGPTGGITIQLHGPAGPYIKLTELGVELGASAAGPSIKLTPAGIDIGNGALTIVAG